MATAFCHFYSYNPSIPKGPSHKRVTDSKGSENSDIVIKPRLSNSHPKFYRKRYLKSWNEPENFMLKRAICDYLESGQMESALCLFEKLNQVDTYICNVMIRGFTNMGFYREAIDLYYTMEFKGIQADNFTYPFVIKSVGALLSFTEGEKIHTKLHKVGLDLDVYICNSLISMYSKLGFIELAEKVFEEMPMRDLVTWNSMISGYASVKDGWSSLMCFIEMQEVGIRHDRFSMINALGACSLQCFEQSGKEIHCQVLKCGLEMDVMIQTTLIDMYGKCGRVDYAERLFDLNSLKGLVTWNAMIGVYTLNSRPVLSFSCFRKMQETDNLNLDMVTLINLIPSCAQCAGVLEGKSVHGHAIRKGFLPNLVLESSLVNMYGECGELKMAVVSYGQMDEKNLVSRNAMIAAYVQNGQNKEALEFFKHLLSKPLEIDSVTIASVLPAYAQVASLREGKQIHGYILKCEYYSNTVILNSLIYMYAKCGDLCSAQRTFDTMMFRDVVSWNTLIMAYGIHGLGSTSVKLFAEMREKGVKPNGSTFVSLLSSFSISGMNDLGWQYFNSMKSEFGISPGIEHYGCVVDLIGRSGELERAKTFIEEMPLAPTARIWGSLLKASRNNRNIEYAKFAAKKILSIEHDNTGCYVLLANLYAGAGRWNEVEQIKSLMTKNGLEKTVGYSIVETKYKSHTFFDHDRSHQETNMIYDVLDVVSRRIRQDDCVHSTTHSVRLAICYGLISTKMRNPVLVRKNMRICEDCHVFAKKLSEMNKREIIVGDFKVFHHFREGCCSCGDYW